MRPTQMQIDLNRLEPGRSSQSGDVELTVRDAGGNDEPHLLHVQCELDVQGRRVRVDAHVAGEARSQCHRCLTEFARPIDTRFELIVQRGGESPGDDVVALPESALEFDLTPHVREAVILEEPIRLLCQPDCKGLCSQCGQDRNVASCSCAPPADARWEALKKLSDQLES